MKLNTSIDNPKSEYEINHKDKIMMLGSCFIQNIGRKMVESKFNTDINPFGVLYNPFSISKSIKILLQKKTLLEKDLFEYNGIYNSFSHHSSFSNIDPNKCLENINIQLEKSTLFLREANILFITFGTSYVYQLKETNQIVANCHKLPTNLFNRFRLDIDQIVNEWINIINDIRKINPCIKIIFTVSPIRHIKDGLHDNQISKSVLLIAIDHIQKRLNNIDYFPSYEILMDDLRDYRFYSEDMVHPNNTAIEYIWEIFKQTYFNKNTLDLLKEWNKIQSALNHRPINKHSEGHKQFLKQTMLKLKSFSEKYTYICCNKDIETLTLKINENK